jgi:excisionase family DNA binding protein
MKAEGVESELLRVPEVAERLRCTDEVVRRKIRSGELPGVRLGSGPRAPLRVGRSPPSLPCETLRLAEERHIRRVAIIARLKSGTEQQAAELLAQGPPFDAEELGLHRHTAYLSADEVVFVFEGPEVDATLDSLVGYPVESSLRAAFDAWRPLVEEPPRIARPAYEWERETK